MRVGQSAPGHHDGGWHLTGTLGTIAAGAAAAQAARPRCAADDACARHRRDAGGRHAAEPRHHVQVVPRRHGGVERAARGAACAAGLRQFGGDRRGQARLRAHLQQCRQARSWCSISSARAGRSRATATSPMPAAWCCIRSSTPWSRSASSVRSSPTHIARIEARVHPIAVRITGLGDPKTGLQSKFSIYHAAAVAYLDRGAGIAQFTDARAAAPDVVALRGKIEVTTDESFRKDQAQATLVTVSGERIEVAHRARQRHGRQSDVGPRHRKQIPRQRRAGGRRRARAANRRDGVEAGQARRRARR